jgi:catalase
LKALAGSGPDVASPKPVEVFLGSHPAALAFVQAPKPFPVSFATEAYFGVTAFHFANAEGETRFGRYRIEPAAGLEHLSDEDAKGKDGDYLVTEIAERVGNGPVKFTVKAQLADAGDVVDDATIPWPAEREVVTLGEISLDAVVADQAAEQKQMIFDPIPRVEGIEPSEDPLLELRAAVYLISGRRRRKA